MSDLKQTSSKLDDELKKLFSANDIYTWRLFEWIKSNTRSLIFLFSTIALIIVALIVQSHYAQRAVSQTEALKQEWIDPASNRADILSKLQPELKARPEGFAGWKGSLMQSALLLDQIEWVEKWRVWPSSKETADIPELSLLWKASSEAAILSAKKEFSAALALVEKTLSKSSAAEHEAEKMMICQLYLQKALLYQQTEKPSKEKDSWKELLSFLGVNLEPSLTGAKLEKPLSGWQDTWIQSWSEEKASLLDYIALRLKFLSK